MSALRERAQQITEDYWSARDFQSERVAVAQLILALARLEQERDEAVALVSLVGESDT